MAQRQFGATMAKSTMALRSSLHGAVFAALSGAIFGACGGDGPSAPFVAEDAGIDGATSDAGTPRDAASDAATDAELDRAPPSMSVTTSIITTTHRAVPGKMFGGWGPHLGHLVRRPGGELWFVDDACEPSGATACDVNVNRRIDAHRLGAAGWERRATIPLPSGVQQNTATIVTGDAFESYGVDTSTWRIVRCRLDPTSLVGACSEVPLPLPASTNYIGAAISPDGWKVAWATTVADGGGGSFHWMVDYGSGWNGPRTGSVGGYNDASYVNAAFYGGARKTEMVMHAQLISGLAPAWSFLGAVGGVDTATANAMSFALLASSGDALVSTNDVVVDETTNDTHLLARTESGAAAYFFKPDGGAWSAALATIPRSYRARFVQLADGGLAIVRSDQNNGLAVRISPPGSRTKGQAVDWTKIPEVPIALPDGYANLYAIYAESASSQRTLPSTIDVALVGSVREHEVLHVHIVP